MEGQGGEAWGNTLRLLKAHASLSASLDIHHGKTWKFGSFQSTCIKAGLPSDLTRGPIQREGQGRDVC